MRTYQKGTCPSEKGAEYIFDLCNVLLGTVTGECSPRRLPSTRTVPMLDTLTVGEPYMSPCSLKEHKQRTLIALSVASQAASQQLQAPAQKVRQLILYILLAR